MVSKEYHIADTVRFFHNPRILFAFISVKYLIFGMYTSMNPLVANSVRIKKASETNQELCKMPNSNKTGKQLL